MRNPDLPAGPSFPRWDETFGLTVCSSHRRSAGLGRPGVQIDRIVPLGDRVLDVIEIDALRPAWMRDAACRGSGTSAWFAVNDAGDEGDTARDICCSCRVRSECLDYALASGIRYGIWGGLSTKERRARARRRRTGRGQVA